MLTENKVLYMAIKLTRLSCATVPRLMILDQILLRSDRMTP